MRKIRIMEHISLDGVMQHDDAGDFQHVGWTTPYRTPEGLLAVMQAQGNDFDLLLGRRTYDAWSGFWPKVENSPMADSLNKATKYIVTHHPETLEWGPVESVGGDVVDAIKKLKSSDGPDLVVCGSSTIISILFAEGFVDELVLMVYPILLGKGKRFFADTADAREFAFVKTVTTPTGVLINTFRFVGPLAKSAV